MDIDSVSPAVADVPAIAPGRGFLRLDPHEAAAAQSELGALLVDIRPARLRRESGEIPGSVVVAGPLREWRAGASSPVRVCDLGPDAPVVVVGDGGAASVLAASALYGMGVTRVSDVRGGFPAWAAAGLPTVEGATPAGHVVAADLVLTP